MGHYPVKATDKDLKSIEFIKVYNYLFDLPSECQCSILMLCKDLKEYLWTEELKEKSRRGKVREISNRIITQLLTSLLRVLKIYKKLG